MGDRPGYIENQSPQFFNFGISVVSFTLLQMSFKSFQPLAQGDLLDIGDRTCYLPTGRRTQLDALYAIPCSLSGYILSDVGYDVTMVVPCS